ncbi:DUF6233 domain-containing protein [Streptomyces sp. NPDC056683]|uniref:DUF6233 domain-containing protein n=1 Tax=Streptomyces sp. NPDC056683 TaxID=3345910 RepID=UPI0036A099E2
MWLERIDRKAADLRQRQAEEERSRARRPPAPDWILELNRATGHPVAVHAGDCGMAGRRRRPVGQDDARRLLTTDGLPACPICRPDTSLHIVDGLAAPPVWRPPTDQQVAVPLLEHAVSRGCVPGPCRLATHSAVRMGRTAAHRAGATVSLAGQLACFTRCREPLRVPSCCS